MLGIDAITCSSTAAWMHNYVQPRGSLVRTMTSNSLQKWAYTLDVELDLQPRQSFLPTVSSDSLQRWLSELTTEPYWTLTSPLNDVVLTTAKLTAWCGCTVQRHICLDCDKQQLAEMSIHSWCLNLMYSPGHFCRLCQATVCRDELTSERWFPNECCSVEYNETETVTYVLTDWHVFTAWSQCTVQRLLVWTVTSNSLHKWTDSFTKLCALDIMYNPVQDFCGLCQGTACRDELTAEPHWTLIFPINDWMLNTAK